MTRLMSLHNSLFSALDRLGTHVLPLLARFVFAATLLMYFWRSAATKLGDGIFTQILELPVAPVVFLMSFAAALALVVAIAMLFLPTGES